MTERVDRFTQDQMLAAVLGKKTRHIESRQITSGGISKLDIKPAAHPLSVARERHLDTFLASPPLRVTSRRGGVCLLYGRTSSTDRREANSLIQQLLREFFSKAEPWIGS